MPEVSRLPPQQELGLESKSTLLFWQQLFTGILGLAATESSDSCAPNRTWHVERFWFCYGYTSMLGVTGFVLDALFELKVQ